MVLRTCNLSKWARVIIPKPQALLKAFFHHYWSEISLNTTNRWPVTEIRCKHSILPLSSPPIPFSQQYKAMHNVQSDKCCGARQPPVLCIMVASSAVPWEKWTLGLGWLKLINRSVRVRDFQGQARGPSSWHVMLIGFVLHGRAGGCGTLRLSDAVVSASAALHHSEGETAAVLNPSRQGEACQPGDIQPKITLHNFC